MVTFYECNQIENWLDVLSIPAKLHFCWIGAKLPWAYVFSILSAVENSHFVEIYLHHTDMLDDSDEVRALQHEPSVRLAHIDPSTLLSQVSQSLGLGGNLHALYMRLQSPVARTDVLRVAILYLMGGIYLDLDTITLSSLRPLLDTEQFIGTERIVRIGSTRASHSPTVLTRQLALDLIRKIFKKLPHGWRTFKKIERLYALGVNNAVMGSIKGSDFMAACLNAMVEMPLRDQARRYALGPHLLQAVVQSYQKPGLMVHSPEKFYPLPPEISEHWFRCVEVLCLEQVVSAKTCVVHWYASIHTQQQVAQISPSYVYANRASQLYSALVSTHLRCLTELTAFERG